MRFDRLRQKGRNIDHLHLGDFVATVTAEPSAAFPTGLKRSPVLFQVLSPCLRHRRVANPVDRFGDRPWDLCPNSGRSLPERCNPVS
jgi:hypothetical protein